MASAVKIRLQAGSTNGYTIHRRHYQITGVVYR